MAIRNIKEIINNRGYVIDSNDRKIFEEGDLQSFFGFSPNDAIEFIIYDINDNQLPQIDNRLVRYIKLTTENISDYFLIPEGTVFQRNRLPKEYFIDVERLLGEAGYTNGIFKTQVTLINKRVGSDAQFDKLWIQEISPSRTEIRLLPLKEGLNLNGELLQRYLAFINDYDFREDTILYAFEFIENINLSELITYLRDKYTIEWLNELVSEFKLNGLDTFINMIYEKFIESIIYEFTNRISNLTDINYGSPKNTHPSIILSKDEVIQICKRILTETVNHYLPQQDIRFTTDRISDFMPSVDEVGDIIQSSESDVIVDAKDVEYITTTIDYSPLTERDVILRWIMRIEDTNTNTDSGGSIIPVDDYIEPDYYIEPKRTPITNI
jgi:hypothetical protein